MSLTRNQVIEFIIAALPQADADKLGTIYNLLAPEDPVIPAGTEYFVHQDMVD